MPLWWVCNRSQRSPDKMTPKKSTKRQNCKSRMLNFNRQLCAHRPTIWDRYSMEQKELSHIWLQQHRSPHITTVHTHQLQSHTRSPHITKHTHKWYTFYVWLSHRCGELGGTGRTVRYRVPWNTVRNRRDQMYCYGNNKNTRNGVLSSNRCMHVHTYTTGMNPLLTALTITYVHVTQNGLWCIHYGVYFYYCTNHRTNCISVPLFLNSVQHPCSHIL